MKIQIDIIENPIKDDLLIFDGKKWIPISKNNILDELNKSVLELQDKISELEQRVEKNERNIAEDRGEL